MRILLLIMVAACPRSAPTAPVDLGGDGWTCYTWGATSGGEPRSHCEINRAACERVRAEVPTQFGTGDCVRTAEPWCYERAGDAPYDLIPADPPTTDGTIRRWCYRTAAECRDQGAGCRRRPD